MNETNRMLVLFCFSTFSSQTSRAGPCRGEEWSGAVETALQRRGKEGVEVGSIHIRFELSPHFRALQGKKLLITLMLDIPMHKRVCSAATEDMEVIMSVSFRFTKLFVSAHFLLHCCLFIEERKVKASPHFLCWTESWMACINTHPTSCKIW